MNTSVLIVGATRQTARNLASIHERLRGFRVEFADDPLCVEVMLLSRCVAMVVVDVASGLNQSDLLNLVRDLAQRDARLPVVVIGLDADSDSRAAWIAAGAVECLRRPLDLSRLVFLIDFLTYRHRGKMTSRSDLSPQDLVRMVEMSDLRFESEAGRVLLRSVCRLAAVDSTALLHGETGVGKTRLAHLIHDLSARRTHPFVVVNCGSLSEALIDSELFGHERGAFTGAERDHAGKMLLAGEGTLFIDEIDSLTLPAQGKLLRVVDEREFESVGGERTEQLRARVVAATNRDLEAEVEAGRFRRDLYFRLKVLALPIPPLRERPQEIPGLISLFQEELHRRNGDCAFHFTPKAMEALQRWSWPGNMRELRNVIEHFAVFAEKELIDIDDLAPFLRVEETVAAKAAPPARTPHLRHLAAARWEAERAALSQVLQQCDNNRSQTAACLGISRTALYKKLRQFGFQ